MIQCTSGNRAGAALLLAQAPVTPATPVTPVTPVHGTLKGMGSKNRKSERTEAGNPIPWHSFAPSAVQAKALGHNRRELTVHDRLIA